MNINAKKLTDNSLNKENIVKLLNQSAILVKYTYANYFVPLIYDGNGFSLLYHEEGKMISFAVDYNHLIKNYELYFL